MSFSIRDLRHVAERYKYHDQGTDGVWPRLVWEKRGKSPRERSNDIVEFLGKWKALRFKGGGNLFRKIYKDFLGESSRDLRHLQGKPLLDLTATDFQTILRLGSSFKDHGAPPTTFGKALHFLLPETIMLWDQALVRNTYKLASDPASFVAYQRFGHKLLHHVAGARGIGVLTRLERDHTKTAGYFEPATMILDHMAYFPEFADKAVAALGGHSQAFELE